MEEILDRLWIGDDQDYEKLDKRGWYIVRACKDGPGGHRETLGYATLGAPHGKDYLYVERGDRLVLNLIDHATEAFIPEKIMDKAISYISEHLAAGDKVLVACNHGRSRSVSIIMLYLHKMKELPDHFARALSYMKKIYPPADPGTGMIDYMRKHW